MKIDPTRLKALEAQKDRARAAVTLAERARDDALADLQSAQMQHDRWFGASRPKMVTPTGRDAPVNKTDLEKSAENLERLRAAYDAAAREMIAAQAAATPFVASFNRANRFMEDAQHGNRRADLPHHGDKIVADGAKAMLTGIGASTNPGPGPAPTQAAAHIFTGGAR